MVIIPNRPDTLRSAVADVAGFELHVTTKLGQAAKNCRIHLNQGAAKDSTMWSKYLLIKSSVGTQ